MRVLRVYVRLLPQPYQYQNLSEGADRVGGQLRGDKEYPLQWRNQIWQSLEEGAGKRCSDSVGKGRENRPIKVRGE